MILSFSHRKEFYGVSRRRLSRQDLREEREREGISFPSSVYSFLKRDEKIHETGERIPKTFVTWRKFFSKDASREW